MSKSLYREIYQVSFSLGTNPNNVVWEFDILGKPTESKIKGFITELIKKMQGTVHFDDGMPADWRTVSKYQQCLYLLERFGLLLDTDNVCINEDFSEPLQWVTFPR